MVKVIHFNGAPGVGKSSVARRYLEDHPLALLVDIDAIRTSLGCWEQVDESKLVARTLAVALVKRQLHDGRDVVVPQYLGRHDFITTLEKVARESAAMLIEVWLDAPPAVAVERFHARRADLLSRGAHHPQTDVAEDAVEAAVEDAMARLATLAVERRNVIRVDADQPIELLYEEVVTALRSREQ